MVTGRHQMLGKSLRLLLTLTLILVIMISLASGAVGHDKYLHFSVSFTLYGFFQGVLDDEVPALAATMAVGAVKELSDLFLNTGAFEYGDLLANLMGSLAAFHYCRSLSFRPFIVFWVVF